MCKESGQTKSLENEFKLISILNDLTPRVLAISIIFLDNFLALLMFKIIGKLLTCKAWGSSPAPTLPSLVSPPHSEKIYLILSWKEKCIYLNILRKVCSPQNSKKSVFALKSLRKVYFYLKRSIVFILQSQVPAVHSPEVEEVCHLKNHQQISLKSMQNCIESKWHSQMYQRYIHVLAIFSTIKFVFHKLKTTPIKASNSECNWYFIPSTVLKHRKNCECCPVSLLIVR